MVLPLVPLQGAAGHMQRLVQFLQLRHYSVLMRTPPPHHHTHATLKKHLGQREVVPAHARAVVGDDGHRVEQGCLEHPPLLARQVGVQVHLFGTEQGVLLREQCNEIHEIQVRRLGTTRWACCCLF